MFLRPRLLSARHGHATLLLAALAFALGLGVGTSIGPVTARLGPGAAPEPAGSPAAHFDRGPVRLAHPVEVLRVSDGDTFEARVHLWPGLTATTRVRLRGIDAPELRARCGDERSKAEAAREALRVMLDQGAVGIARVTFDKYGGRAIADASTSSTPDVSAVLLKTGMVRSYKGGRRDGWCSDGAR
jgi:endonuclease YncB( thermonuclease family)